jgi:hypothetical protein
MSQRGVGVCWMVRRQTRNQTLSRNGSWLILVGVCVNALSAIKLYCCYSHSAPIIQINNSQWRYTTASLAFNTNDRIPTPCCWPMGATLQQIATRDDPQLLPSSDQQYLNWQVLTALFVLCTNEGNGHFPWLSHRNMFNSPVEIRTAANTDVCAACRYLDYWTVVV